jgi:hypothetical protein
MRRSQPAEPVEARTERRAYTLYLLIYLPVFIGVLVVLGLAVPYLLFGIEPSFPIRAIEGWKPLWILLYLFACAVFALVAAAIAWLLAARRFVAYSLAERVLMPMGSDPLGRWLIRRFLPTSQHDV